MPVIHAMHPLIILSVYFKSCLSFLLTPKGFLLHLLITLALDYSLCPSCSTWFPVYVLKLYHTVHTSSPPPCFFRDWKEPHCFILLLSSFSVAHHSFSMHEGVHNNIINTQHSGHTECNDPWLLTKCLIVIFFLMSSCVMKHNGTPQRILSINADIPTVADILLKIIPTLEEVRMPIVVAYVDECHLLVELTLLFCSSISITRGWTSIASCGCWSIRV